MAVEWLGSRIVPTDLLLFFPAFVLLRRCVKDITQMVTRDVVLLGTFWYLLRILPELMQYVGYLFGFLLGNWAVERYLRSD